MGDNEIVQQALKQIGVETKHLLALSDSLFELDDDELELKLQEERNKAAAGVIIADGENSDVGMKDEDLLREEGKELTFQDFLRTVVHLRPENDCSVMDVAEVRKMMRRSTRKTRKQIDEFGQGIVNLEKAGVPHHHVNALCGCWTARRTCRRRLEQRPSEPKTL